MKFQCTISDLRERGGGKSSTTIRPNVMINLIVNIQLILASTYYVVGRPMNHCIATGETILWVGILVWYSG